MSEAEKEQWRKRELLKALIVRELNGWLNRLCRELGDILIASSLAEAKSIDLNKKPDRVSVKEARQLILSFIPEATETLVVKYIGEDIRAHQQPADPSPSPETS